MITSREEVLKIAEEMNKKVHAICHFGSINKGKNPVAEYATQLHKKNDSNTNDSIESLMQLANYMNGFYTPGREPKTPADRMLFVSETIKSCKTFSFVYAYGNCAPMADIVFLESIYRGIPEDITYLRFIQKGNPRVDEINVIALGKWPEPGCLIISPWEGKQGKCYFWQGSEAKTQEVIQKGHNHTNVLFHLKNLSQEKVLYKKMLVTARYEAWLENPERLRKMKEIRDHFLMPMEEAWKKTGMAKKWGYQGFSTYQDFLLFGCVNKTKNARFKEVKQILERSLKQSR
ncbi:MAG TPA: hypothetical protein VLI69_01710 [Gammaproteobacteria bacterium]|nr:hypothetical protein [Gammaproteobacteria bacterium]